MPQQCSYPAKTKFDSMHVVVQGQAEQVCIVVCVCCACGRWVQQKCLYYVPQLTALRSQHFVPSVMAGNVPRKKEALSRSCKGDGTVSSPALPSMGPLAVDEPTFQRESLFSVVQGGVRLIATLDATTMQSTLTLLFVNCMGVPFKIVSETQPVTLRRGSRDVANCKQLMGNTGTT